MGARLTGTRSSESRWPYRIRQPDHRVEPTYIWDLNLPLPFEDGLYDNVISLNTFEHVYEDKVAITEGLRVLRRCGGFHFLVPFIYRVHASPGDYHRHTAEWWQRTISTCGVSDEQFSVTPLVWNPASTAACLRGLTGGAARAAVMGSAFEIRATGRGDSWSGSGWWASRGDQEPHG